MALLIEIYYNNLNTKYKIKLVIGNKLKAKIITEIFVPTLEYQGLERSS